MWDVICLLLQWVFPSGNTQSQWGQIFQKKSKYNIVMCDKEVHELLIQESHINCIFCNKQIQDPDKPKRYFCCDSMRLIKDGFIVCKNCGQIHDYLTADEYVDFYENRHRIKRKSVYHRKYHILNVINDIANDNNIQVGYYNREKILRIFRLIDQVIPQVNNFRRRRLISVNFIIKQLFDQKIHYDIVKIGGRVFSP